MDADPDTAAKTVAVAPPVQHGRCQRDLDSVLAGVSRLALLADTDAVATQVLGRFAPATEITDELQAVMASESYNTPGKPRAEPGLTS